MTSSPWHADPFRAEGGELRPDQIVERGAGPLLLHQQVVGVGQRLDARVEAFLEFLTKLVWPGCLSGDGEHNGEQILGAVRQLAHDQADMSFTLVAVLVMLFKCAGGGDERVERAIDLSAPVFAKVIGSPQHQRVSALFDLLDRAAIRRAAQIESSRASSVAAKPASPAIRMVRVDRRFEQRRFRRPGPTPIHLIGDVAWAFAMVSPSSDIMSFQPLRGAARRVTESFRGGLADVVIVISRACDEIALAVDQSGEPAFRQIPLSNSEQEDRWLHHERGPAETCLAQTGTSTVTIGRFQEAP